MSGWLAPRGMELELEVAFITGAENLSDPPNKSERFPAAAAGGGLEATEGGGAALVGATGPPRSARKSKVFVSLTGGVAASSRLMLDFSCAGGWEAGNPDMSDSCLEDPASDNPRRSTVEDGDAEDEVFISGVVVVVAAVAELSCSLLRSGLLT